MAYIKKPEEYISILRSDYGTTRKQPSPLETTIAEQAGMERLPLPGSEISIPGVSGPTPIKEGQPPAGVDRISSFDLGPTYPQTPEVETGGTQIDLSGLSPLPSKRSSLEDIQRYITGARSSLGDITSDFYSLAGDIPEYGPDIESLLRNAVYTGSGLSEAEALVDLFYGGEHGIPAEFTGPINQRVGEYIEGILKPLERGEGIVDYLKLVNPELTRGEALYDAQRQVGEGILLDASQTRREASGFLNDLLRAQEETSSFAEEMAPRASETSRKSRTYVEGLINEILGSYEKGTGIRGRAQTTEEAERALSEAYKKFRETGDLTELIEKFGVPKEWANKYLGSYSEAKKMYNDILAKYPDLSSIPVAQLDATILYNPEKTDYSGSNPDKNDLRRFVEIDGVKYDLQRLMNKEKKGSRGVIAGMSKKETMALAARILERQRELEALFAPAFSLENEGDIARGAYAEILPLYTGGLGEITQYMPDVRDFLSLIEGVTPTELSEATPEEAAQIERALDIIDSQQQFEKQNRTATQLTSGTGALEKYTRNVQDYKRASARILQLIEQWLLGIRKSNSLKALEKELAERDRLYSEILAEAGYA